MATEIQRAKLILDTIQGTAVDAALAIRIGEAIALVRRNIQPGTLTNTQLSGAILWELRTHLQQMLIDAEARIATEAAKAAIIADVGAIDLGTGGEIEL